MSEPQKGAGAVVWSVVRALTVGHRAVDKGLYEVKGVAIVRSNHPAKTEYTTAGSVAGAIARSRLMFKINTSTTN